MRTVRRSRSCPLCFLLRRCQRQLRSSSLSSSSSRRRWCSHRLHRSSSICLLFCNSSNQHPALHPILFPLLHLPLLLLLQFQTQHPAHLLQRQQTPLMRISKQRITLVASVTTITITIAIAAAAATTTTTTTPKRRSATTTTRTLIWTYSGHKTTTHVTGGCQQTCSTFRLSWMQA